MSTPRLPRANTLGELITEMATRWPARPAIGFEGTDVTFAALDQEVNRWSKAFLAAGAHKGSPIAVLAGNRPEWLYATMGALRIGAVAVPVNTWYRQDELRYLLDHSDAEFLVFTDRLRTIDYVPIVDAAVRTLRESGTASPLSDGDLLRRGRMIELGEHRLDAATPCSEFLDAGSSISDDELARAVKHVTADDLAYIIYTSGSTARPKGVELEHRHAIVNTFHIGKRQALTEDDRSFVASPLFYGLGVIQALGATWTHGACVVLMEVYEPGRALQILEEERCTAYYGLGNMTRSLVDHPDHGVRKLSLSKGVLGLSVADRKLARTELDLPLGTSIYGLTESYGLCALTDAHDPPDRSINTIGKPLPDWDIRIADPHTDEPLHTGEVGQILIRGHVMRGYHKDESRTRDAMTDDGYFKTGDLGFFDEDGYLHFHSRLSEIMKPGGINVSPLEVELLIGELDGVGEVHVVGVPDEARDEAIVAFVELIGESEDITAYTITEHVRKRAAKYKAPQHVLFMSASQLPRVASGKVPKGPLRELAVTEIARQTADATQVTDVANP